MQKRPMPVRVLIGSLTFFISLLLALFLQSFLEESAFFLVLPGAAFFMWLILNSRAATKKGGTKLFRPSYDFQIRTKRNDP